MLHPELFTMHKEISNNAFCTASNGSKNLYTHVRLYDINGSIISRVIVSNGQDLLYIEVNFDGTWQDF